jgi:hypothetical protein
MIVINILNERKIILMNKIKGFLYDIARGMRGDADYIESIIRRLSEYGYNMLIINLEYRFKFLSHPSIGPSDSLSPEDIKRLDKVCNELGMELVPFANCAGHIEGIGLLEKYKDLSVDPTGVKGSMQQMLSIGQAEKCRPEDLSVEQFELGNKDVEKLIFDLYDDLMECFSSKYFHIGFDEVRQMHVQMPDATEEERWEKVMEYLFLIVDYVKNKGKTPMMWVGSTFAHNPERRKYIEQLPKDTIIIDGSYSNKEDDINKLIKTLEYQKLIGFDAVACSAVNGFRGTPIVSQVSTGNIRKVNAAQEKIYGDTSKGVLLATWEYNFGGCFSAQWPWIYLQSEIFKGRDSGEMNFLREYTSAEWGLETNELEQWYDYIDIAVQNIIAKNADENEFIKEVLKNTIYGAGRFLYDLRKSLFRSRNILQGLQDARIWATPDTISEIIQTLEKAKVIAQSMSDKAIKRKEESQRLLQWNNTFLAIFELLSLIGSLNKHYTIAAINQGENADKFRENLLMCADIMSEMLSKTEVLKEWSETLVSYENNVEEEKWWIVQAQKDLKKRMSELLSTLHNNRTLINFNRFVRFEADIPNRVFNR